MRKRFGILLLAAVLAAAFAPTGAKAASDRKSSAAAQEGRTAASIDGFRSARFGMTEEEVRKVMRNDLSVKDSQIEREQNPVERTTVLSADVKELLPGAGPARVSYVLGFSSKKLIHVNVVWAREIGGASLEQLATAASALQVHFAGQDYKAGSVVTNAELPDGTVLLFRGTDAKGRMVLLVAGGMAGKKDSKQAAEKAFVRLSYVLSPTDPDIFRIKPGEF